METEAQGGESDLPKVIMGMRSGTEIEIAKPASVPRGGDASAASPSGVLEGSGLHRGRKEPAGASCLCRTMRISPQEACLK